MKSYQSTSEKIKDLIFEVFQNLSPDFSHTGHPKWKELKFLLEETNEISGYRVCKTSNPDMHVVVLPLFVENFNDSFFSEKNFSVCSEKKTEKFNHRRGWTGDHLRELYTLPGTLEAVEKYSELVINTTSKDEKYTFLIGPIGYGKKTFTSTLKHFHERVVTLSSRGVNILDNTPLEPFFEKIVMGCKLDESTWKNALVNNFSKKILESGKIAKLVQLPGWASMDVSKEQCNLAKSMKIETVEYSKMLVQTCVQQ